MLETTLHKKEKYRRWSPYVYGVNNPVRFIDPDGMGIFDAGKGSGTDAWEGLKPLMAEADASAEYNNWLKHGGGSFSLSVAAMMYGASQEGTVNQTSEESGEDDDWLPFYKKDLIAYVANKELPTDDNTLGNEFENIFESYMNTENPAAAKTFRFRRSVSIWIGGKFGNSKPDFVADDFYDVVADCWVCPKRIKWVIEGSGYEVKQNGGAGIYLSSNDNQIKHTSVIWHYNMLLT